MHKRYGGRDSTEIISDMRDGRSNGFMELLA